MNTPRNLNILKGFNILYIEDDRDLLEHTTDVLEDFVNHIYAVTGAQEAMEVIQKHKIDVIVSDILLEKENGIDFLHDLKGRDICIPAILTTAHTDTQYLLDAIKLKVEGYIVKPINIKELLDNLYDVLLPSIQQADLIKQNNIIKMISIVTDNKQVEVINYIIKSLDYDNCFTASYGDIMDAVNISKPTLIKLFKQFLDGGILQKIDYKTYRFDQQSLDRAAGVAG
ncbi:MAG: response regulator, partial [Campylobacterota bacterium]